MALTKLLRLTFIPATPGHPAVPAVTICPDSPPPNNGGGTGDSGGGAGVGFNPCPPGLTLTQLCNGSPQGGARSNCEWVCR